MIHLSSVRTVGLLCFAASLSLGQSPSADSLFPDGDFEANPSGWVFVSTGGAKGEMQIVTDKPLDAQSPHSLMIKAEDLGQTCGAATAATIPVAKDEWFDIHFASRVEGVGSVGLLFSLETADGKAVCARTTLPEIGRVGTPIQGNTDGWRTYLVTLHAYAANPGCRLVISPIEPATAYIDALSMQRREPGVH